MHACYWLYSIMHAGSISCVQKAVYCTGEAVSGVQSINFSIDCTECSTYDASFQFQVYSGAFGESIDT